MSNREWTIPESDFLDRVINYVVQNTKYSSGRWLQRVGGIYFEFTLHNRRSVWMNNKEVLDLMKSKIPDDLGSVLIDRLV